MEVQKELVLEKGSEACRLVVYKSRTTGEVSAVMSHQDDGQCVHWETTAQIDFAGADTWELFVEALVALKLKDGFRVSDHLSADSTDGDTRSTVSFNSYLMQTALDPQQKMQIEGEDAKKERKGGTSILQLAQYFDHPINDAAKLLDICPTVLKKICRKNGLKRWPHRKLRSIEKKLTKIKSELAQSQMITPDEILKKQRELDELQNERAYLRYEHWQK